MFSCTHLTHDSTELTSRSGLKEAHARFEYVAKKLEIAFGAATLEEKEDDWDIPILSAVAAIWSEMCVDAVLCRKLLARGQSHCLLEMT